MIDCEKHRQTTCLVKKSLFGILEKAGTSLQNRTKNTIDDVEAAQSTTDMPAACPNPNALQVLMGTRPQPVVSYKMNRENLFLYVNLAYCLNSFGKSIKCACNLRFILFFLP